VVTDGVSMHPRIHTGDLALVRPAGTYRVGDIAAYRSRTLHVTVLHRIVAVTPGGYVFKGDSNSWRDPERVSRGQIVGKLWVLAPGLGGRLRELRSPLVMALLAGLATILLAGGAGVRHVRRRRRRRRPEPKWKPAAATPRRRPVGSPGGLAAALAALALCGLVAVVAWTAPTRRTVPTQVSYLQSGRFSYAASADAPAVYRTGQVTTAQPMFSRLVGPVQVRFAYALRAPGAADVSGSASLRIVLASQTGWTRTIPLEQPAPFSGGRAAVAGIVHLRRLERLLVRVASATAVPDEAFTLTLVPSVHVHGTVAGRPFGAAYAPRLPFTLTPYELAPVLPARPAGAAPAAPASLPMFRPTATGVVSARTPVAVTLGAGRLRVPVWPARIAGLLGVAASLLAALLAWRAYRRGREADEPTRIRARYGESIVTVVHSSLGRHAGLVEVRSIEELARLAERYDSMIIHEQTDLGHAYLVADGTALYAYLLDAPGSERGLRDVLLSRREPRSGGLTARPAA
jgi:signal peptidase I